MRSLILAVLLTVAATCPPLSAGTILEHSVNGTIGRGFGHTTYILTASYYDDERTLRSVKSELEFPLDVLTFGAEYGGLLWRDGRPFCALEAGFAISISDPASKMFDHDWIKDGGPSDNSNPWDKFSYTESGAQMSGTYMRVEGSYWLLHFGDWHLAAQAAFRYLLIKQDLVGYEGWQIRDNGDRVEISGDARGIFYKVSYKLPSVGVRVLRQWHDTFRFDLRMAYVHTLVDDFDDHVLRNKIGVADVDGPGGSAQLSFRYTPTSQNRSRVFLELHSDLLFLDAFGSQTQTWYGDDPASDEDDTGSVVGGIPHDIDLFQVQLSLKAGISF